MSYNPYVRYSSYWWRYWLNGPFHVCSFLKRVWDYRKPLWEDNDYDYAAIIHMMRFKFKRLRNHMERHGLALDTEDRVAELAYVDMLFRNALDEDPDNEWTLHWDRFHTWTAELECHAERECAIAAKLAEERAARNWHTLWKYLDKHMQKWWD